MIEDFEEKSLPLSSVESSPPNTAPATDSAAPSQSKPLPPLALLPLERLPPASLLFITMSAACIAAENGPVNRLVDIFAPPALVANETPPPSRGQCSGA